MEYWSQSFKLTTPGIFRLGNNHFCFAKGLQFSPGPFYRSAVPEEYIPNETPISSLQFTLEMNHILKLEHFAAKKLPSARFEMKATRIYLYLP
jgi:hypothetical protein